MQEPIARLYSFWCVIDQDQKHFHYSKLYLQFIKNNTGVLGFPQKNPGNPERLHLISIRQRGK